MLALDIVASPELDAQVTEVVFPIMMRLGEEVITSMRDHHTYVDRTGQLTASFNYEVDDEGNLTVGATEFYSRFLEEGTSKMAAQPFLLPALLTHAGLIE